MTIREGTLLADSVLALVNWMSGDSEYLFAEPYLNGRERGWAISSMGKTAVFSEFRNSDEIVVYRGKSVDFEMAGNVPSDKVYKEKRTWENRLSSCVNRRKLIIEMYIL